MTGPLRILRRALMTVAIWGALVIPRSWAEGDLEELTLPEEVDLEDTLPSFESLLWDGSVTLRTWAGYKDNPQLSALNPVGSAFVAGGGDLLLLRLPLDGKETSLLVAAEQVNYLEGGLYPETVVIADGRFKRTWDGGWLAGFSVEYLYMRQVFDASEIEGVRTIVAARGHNLALRPVVGHTLGGDWRLEIEGEGSRQWLAEPLDSFWDSGGEVSAIRTMSNGGEILMAYRYRDRQFDTRLSRDAGGRLQPNRLAYRQHDLEAEWRSNWGTKGIWRTTLRGGWLRSLDNGGGYYDYDRFHARAGVRFAPGRWEFRGDVDLRWYQYPVQLTGADADRHRRRLDLRWTARAEWKPVRGVGLYVEYALETSDENLPAADYRVNAISAGLSLEH